MNNLFFKKITYATAALCVTLSISSCSDDDTSVQEVINNSEFPVVATLPALSTTIIDSNLGEATTDADGQPSLSLNLKKNNRLALVNWDGNIAESMTYIDDINARSYLADSLVEDLSAYFVAHTKAYNKVESSAVAVFPSRVFYGFNSDSSTEPYLTLRILSQQEYVENGIDPLSLMTYDWDYDASEGFDMTYLQGFFRIGMKGSEIIKSITIDATDTDFDISGFAKVEKEGIVSISEGSKTLTLDCEDGIQLNNETFSYFNMPLIAISGDNWKKCKIIVKTDKGKSAYYTPTSGSIVAGAVTTANVNFVSVDDRYSIQDQTAFIHLDKLADADATRALIVLLDGKGITSFKFDGEYSDKLDLKPNENMFSDLNVISVDLRAVTGLTELPTSAFNEGDYGIYSNLESLYLPDCVKTIGNTCLYNLPKLITFSAPGAISVGNWGIFKTLALQNLDLSSVIHLGKHAIKAYSLNELKLTALGNITFDDGASIDGGMSQRTNLILNADKKLGGTGSPIADIDTNSWGSWTFQSITFE